MLLAVVIALTAGSPETQGPPARTVQAPVTVEVDMPYVGEVTWGHMRMNHPETIVKMFEEVQQGKLPHEALRGLASPARLNALLKVKWDAARIERVLPPPAPEQGARPRIAAGALRNLRGTEKNAWEGLQVAAVGNAFVTSPEYEPKLVKFGEVYEGERSRAKLFLTSPTEGLVTVSLPAGSPFKIHKMTSLSGKIVAQGKDGKILGIDREVTKGPWVIQANAGQDLWIECEFTEQFDMFKSTAGMRKDVLQIRGESGKANPAGGAQWSAKVPVEGRFLGKDMGVIAFTTDADLQMITPNGYDPKQPHRLELSVRLINTKDAVAGRFVAGPMPIGVSVQGTPTVSLAKGETRDVKVPILVDRSNMKGIWFQQWGTPHTAAVRFEYGNGRSTEMLFSITQFPIMKQWTRKGECGSVRYVADLFIYSDGHFRFTAICTNQNWVASYTTLFDGRFDGIQYVNAATPVSPKSTKVVSYGFKRPIFQDQFTTFVYKPFKLKITTR
jgi:hypothetical protein